MHDPEIDKELRYHLDRLVRDHISAGLSEAEARRRALLEFGGPVQIREDIRDVRGHVLSDFAQDLRYAWRTLRRSPAFLTVSVLSLALAIGANTAIFSLINALMLRALPIPHPERLVLPTRLSAEGDPAGASIPYFELIHNQWSAASHVAVEEESAPEIVLDGLDENVPAELVSGEFFPMLGIRPALGRLLEPADDVEVPDAPAAVISYDYWQRRFAGNPSVIGKTFSYEGIHRIATIVGVMPKGFTGVLLDRPVDFILPLMMTSQDAHWHDPTNYFLNIFASLKPGETASHANTQFQVLWAGWRAQIAATLPQSQRAAYLRRRAEIRPASTGLSYVREDYSSALLILMGIVGLVLLLACANLSGMLLARASARRREISIRLAIGAGSGRLLRQFLTESLLLTAIGGSIGLILARYLSRALLANMADSAGNSVSIDSDWRVLLFTAAVSLAACVLAGLAPGWHALRANLNPALKNRYGNPALGKALVAGQLAISMVLVVGSVLFTGTLVELQHVDRGLRTNEVLTLRVRSGDAYVGQRQWQNLDALEDRLNQIPGVASASLAQDIPLGGGIWYQPVEMESGSGVETESVAFNAVGPKYLATVGQPLLLGRTFTVRDDAASPKVAIVNESFARRFFPGRSPLGRRVKSRADTLEIVGVVRDARTFDLRHAPEKAMLIPWRQHGSKSISYGAVIRVAAGEPAALAPILPDVVRQADPQFRIRALKTYDALIADTISTERIMAALGGFFGAIALLIACLGVFGVMAFQVSRRTNEIGVRMALGAARSGIVALVVREAAFLILSGCAIGALAALTLAGVTRKMLFGVTPNDPAVFAIAAAALAIAALAAAWVPARRAARIDPLAALRQD